MYFKILLLLFITLYACKKKENEEFVYTQDVDNYWNAYDKIITTKDSILQRKYLEEEFINKASLGQQTMFKVRNCTPEEYLYNINKYPKFWESIRKNTLKSKGFTSKIESGLHKLKSFYPELKPAKVYFTIGAFKTGGTAIDSTVVFGTEKQFLDPTINTSEFVDNAFGMNSFSKTNPIKNVGFTAIHEFIHTQQENFIGGNLLTACLFEGVAEFVTEKISGKESNEPCIKYGKKNSEIIMNQFKIEMFNDAYSYWLWSAMPNKFNQRDLGYYIGYAIADKFYKGFKGDKKLAIKKLIEVDYSSNEKVIKFVNSVGFFEKSIEEIRKENEIHRPYVVSIKEFKNKETNVDSEIKTLTVEFSEPMNHFSNFKLGPLGAENLIRFTGFNGWSDDNKKISYKVKLKPSLRQQILITDVFQSKKGYPLKPFLIDITTK